MNLNLLGAGVTCVLPPSCGGGIAAPRNIFRLTKNMNRNEINRINQHTGGSTLTKKGRESTLLAFAQTLRATLNIQVRSFGDLKIEHIRRYVEYTRAQGVSNRTLQNQMSRLRTALRVCGRDKFANDKKISNKSIGIGRASRNGTHVPFNSIEENKRIGSISDPGVQAAARLQREMGLRMQEAIRSIDSLSTWMKELQSHGLVTIIHGTKGGRRRIVDFNVGNAKCTAINAVQNAIEVLQKQSELVASKSLQGACRKYQRELAAVGFSGAQASHSLRCSWAQDQYFRHLTATQDNRMESLSRLSLDLGHGDGRGRYCRQVYLKNSAK
ncbi:MAG: DNA-binding protein [Betaproteobacteria bacterium HGW-Betaproteobacteria-9]|jgi:site-specific recombinase XerC|nr:MAG: DNA-binding protein [Betaproteobacteria bacterium HGW-Betaproteobacteria-9]